MGLFSSDSTSKQKTYVNTNTTTTVRDIGVTGQNAVDLAGLSSDAGVRIAQIGADLVEHLGQVQGQQYQQLVAGASHVFGTQPVESSGGSGGGFSPALLVGIGVAILAVVLVMVKR